MRLVGLLFVASVLAASQSAAASPFGEGRSEGAPPTKKKPKKAKKQKPKPTEADESLVVIEDKPAKAEPAKKVVAKAKPAPKKPKRPVVEDDVDVVVLDDEDEAPVAKKIDAKPKKAAAATAADDDENPIATRPAKKIEPKKIESKKPVIDDDEDPIAKADAKPAKKTEPRKIESKKPVIEDDEPVAKSDKKKPVDGPGSEIDDEEAEDDTDATKQTAALDDDGEEIDDVQLTKTVAKPRKRTTRFYFRAGALRESSKLGDTQFALQTELPVDTSGLGAGSGVEVEKSQIPVGVIIGYVLPVLDGKLSVETVLGIPGKSKFKATGALADQSLAPTFMGMQTGIEPLGPDLAEATFAPPMLTAVYRIAELGRVTPIAGTGIMLLMARGAKVTNPVLNEAGDPKLKITPSPGLVLQGGLDIRITNRFHARVDAKYVLGMRVNATIEDIAVTPKAIPALGSIDVGDAVMSSKVTPFVLQAGIGADF